MKIELYKLNKWIKYKQISKPTNYKKPGHGTKDLHSLHGQLRGTHFLIFSLNRGTDDMLFRSIDIKFQIFGPSDL